MLKLNAIKSEKIWGYELWIASTHPNGCQEDFKSFCSGDYPLLVKVIQADDILSIQVHPDDELAVKFEGPGNRGKTECWYVLDAKPGAKVVYGIKEGYSDEVLAKAITDNTLENYLDMYEVKRGDFIFIPAGTVHAIGAGLRLMEVQQSCDLTYRLYDWGRGREVHIEKGLAVIKREEMIPVAPFPGKFECKYFSLQELEVSGEWNRPSKENSSEPSSVELFYVLESSGAEIQDGKQSYELKEEEIFAAKADENILIKGQAKIMHIRANKC